MNFGAVNMAPLEDAFVLPFREKPSARKEIESLKQRISELEHDVFQLANEVEKLKQLQSEPSSMTKVMSSVTESVTTFIEHIPLLKYFVSKPIKPIEVSDNSRIFAISEQVQNVVENVPKELVRTCDGWKDTGTNKIPVDILNNQMNACMEQRAREDEEIKNSLPSREDAERAFNKFNDERDEEAFKIYSDYIDQRGFDLNN